jgi:cobalt-zinc-cadmium efflux system membrane fusion protein
MSSYKLIPILCLVLAACGSKEASEPSAHHDDEDAHEGPQHVELTADQIKAASIDVVTAGPAQIREALSLYGAIAPNAERVRDVGARYAGVIREVTRSVGDTVRQGEPLATVESNESLQTYSIVAPLAGVVTARSANPGEQTGDKPLFTVADLSSVWIELALFPRDLPKVRVGQQVRVSQADGAMSAIGKVVYVAPFGSAASQTLTARVLLDNPERRWAPGLYVNAEVTLAETQVPIALANEALQTLDGRTVIFVRTSEGFAPHAVRLGRADSEHSEVLDGIAAGESYASRNSFILKAELGKGEAEHEH